MNNYAKKTVFLRRLYEHTLMEKKQRDKRSFFNRMNLYLRIYRRNGLLHFLLVNVFKLILILVLIIGLIVGLNELLLYMGFDVTGNVESLIDYLGTEFVLLLFFATESVLGWIPPDFFIMWGKLQPTNIPYLNVGILATISYMGGVVAYHLGLLIRRFPKVNRYVKRRFEKNFHLIERWGGVVVVMSALFPLPFATISTVAGVVRYPFRQFLLYGLTRYLRFYLYAAWIFWGLDQLV
jgi:membrane protein YqaA with SNARE-associated domain